MTDDSVLAERLAEHGRSLSRAERLVAEYLVTVPADELPFLGATQIARATGTSDASVIRAARSLGFTGLPELKRVVTRQRRMTMSRADRIGQRLATMPGGVDAAARASFEALRELVDDNERLLDPAGVERAVAVLTAARTVWVVGIGTAGAAALHLADRLTRAGHPARWTRAAGFDLANELLAVQENDALVVFHSAAPVREFADLVSWAHDTGVPTVLVTGTQLAARYGDRADAVLACAGTASAFAQWTVAATHIAELLGNAVTAADATTATEASRRLGALRRHFTDDRR